MTSNSDQTLLTLALDLCLWDRPDCFSVDLHGELYLLGVPIPKTVVSRLDKEGRRDFVRALEEYSKEIHAKLLDDPEVENRAA